MKGSKKKVLTSMVSGGLLVFMLLWPLYMYYVETEPTDTKEKEGEWKGVITLWDYPRLNVRTGSRYGWISDKIKRFERQNPGVYIELETLDWAKGPIKLEVALQSKRYPDIAPVATDYMFMKEGALEPLDTYFSNEEKNAFKYQSLKAVTLNNHIWGVPFMMTTYGLYLNLDIFRERGIDPPLDGNWTYEEFIAKMQKLTYDNDGDGNIDHYGFTSFIKPNYYNIWGMLLSDGAEIINEENGQYSFYGQEALKGVKRVIDLKHEYKVTPPSFGLDDENQAWNMFYKEQNVAVYPTGSWAARVLERQYQEGTGFEFAIANYPIGDRQVPIALNNSVAAYGIFNQEDPGKRDMCVKFLKFITQEKYQEQLEDLAVFPVKKGIEDLYINNRPMKKLEDTLTYTITLPKHKQWKEIDRILQTQIQQAILGEKAAEASIKEAKEQVQQLLNSESR